MHYFLGEISNIDYSLTEPVPILYSSKGLQFSYKRFITGTSSESGFFAKLGLELSSLKGSSIIDLSNQVYDLGVLTMTCRTCGEINVKTSNNSYAIIPSFSIGLQKKISDRASFTLSAGFQYLEIPSVTWESSKNRFPYYVHNKIGSIIEHSNKISDNFGNIIPTIKISTNFLF